MSGLDHTTATYANGRALMAWLDQQTSVIAPSPTVRRRLQRWRAVGQASFWLVDDVLRRAGVHVSDVPEDVWCVYDNGWRGWRRRQVPA